MSVLPLRSQTPSGQPLTPICPHCAEQGPQGSQLFVSKRKEGLAGWVELKDTASTTSLEAWEPATLEKIQQHCNLKT